MRALLILSLALLATKQAGASRQERTRDEIDRAIEHLPRVGCEGGWDSIAGYTLHGAADDLRRYLSMGLRMSDEQWSRALQSAGVLQTRDKWPAGVPFAVSMNAPAWLHPVAMHAVPRDLRLMSLQAGDLAHLHCGFRIEEACAEKQRKAEYQEIGTLELGKHHIVFDVTVEEGSYENGTSFGAAYVRNPRPKLPPGTVLWRGPVAVDIEVVPTLEEAFPATDSTALTEIVRRGLFRLPSGFEQGTGSDFDIRLVLSTRRGDIADIAMSLEFGLYRGDLCLAQGWTLAFPYCGFQRSARPLERVTEIVRLGRVVTDDGIELRVRGVTKDILRDWSAKDWWNGTVSIPLSSVPVLR